LFLISNKWNLNWTHQNEEMLGLCNFFFLKSYDFLGVWTKRGLSIISLKLLNQFYFLFSLLLHCYITKWRYIIPPLSLFSSSRYVKYVLNRLGKLNHISFWNEIDDRVLSHCCKFNLEYITLFLADLTFSLFSGTTSFSLAPCHFQNIVYFSFGKRFFFFFFFLIE
jgi:hypothetical protein